MTPERLKKLKALVGLLREYSFPELDREWCGLKPLDVIEELIEAYEEQELDRIELSTDYDELQKKYDMALETIAEAYIDSEQE